MCSSVVLRSYILHNMICIALGKIYRIELCLVSQRFSQPFSKCIRLGWGVSNFARSTKTPQNTPLSSKAARDGDVNMLRLSLKDGSVSGL